MGLMKHFDKISLTWLWITILLVLTFLAYSPTFDNGFIWDDDSYVTENKNLQSWEGIQRIWTERESSPQYYPLVFSTFWVENQLWGLNPRGYHLTNILLHALNAILAGLVLVKLRVPGAFLIALLFAVHPVQVESVAWVTERKNVLSGFFYLSSLLVYLKFYFLRQGSISATPRNSSGLFHEDNKAWIYYLLSLLLFISALLSKTVSCSLPVVIILLIWMLKDRLSLKDVIPLVPFFVIGLVLGLNTVWMEKVHVGAHGLDWGFTFLERSIIAGRALWFYVGKIILPVGLTFIYPRWDINGASLFQIIFPLFILVIMSALWWLRARLGKGPLVAACIFAITLFPALGFIDYYPMRFSFVADHFQYLASLAIISLVIAAAIRGKEKFLKRVPEFTGHIIGLIIVLTFAFMTWQQAHIYKDEEVLWRDTIRKNPNAWIAHNNLGSCLYDRREYKEAINHFIAALQIKSTEADIHYNLGQAYTKIDRLDLAITEYEQAILRQPDFFKAYNNLGIIYKDKGEIDKALSAYMTAIDLKPDYAKAYANLGALYDAIGKNDDALKAYQKAAQIDSSLTGVFVNIGVAYEKMGRLLNAVTAYQKAIKIDRESGEAYYNLGYIYLRTSREQQAIPLFLKAIEIFPGKPLPYYNCGMAYMGIGEQQKAANMFRKAVEVDPSFAPGWTMLSQTSKKFDRNEPSGNGRVIVP